MLHYKLTALNSPSHRKIRTKTNPIQTADRWMRHIEAPALKLVKQSMGWNNAKEQICNQCTPRLSRYLWFTYESGGIFPTCSAVARSRFLAGVAIKILACNRRCFTVNWITLHTTRLADMSPATPSHGSGLQLSPCVNGAEACGAVNGPLTPF